MVFIQIKGNKDILNRIYTFIVQLKDKTLLGEALNRTGIIRKILDYYIYYVTVVSLDVDRQDIISFYYRSHLNFNFL